MRQLTSAVEEKGETGSNIDDKYHATLYRMSRKLGFKNCYKCKGFLEV